MDWKLDDNGDKAIENGDFVMVTGLDATIQFLQQSLKLFFAEWFLDEKKGFPYFDDVFVKNPDPDKISSVYKTYIIALPGILELLEFDLAFDPAARTLAVTGTIRALDGEADFSIKNVIPGP